MAALIPNIAKGRLMELGALAAAADAFVWVLFTGAETDANVRDAATLTALIATALNEATFAGYARQTATGVVVTVDQANDRVNLAVAAPSWNPTAAQALTRIALCYDYNTGAGTDVDIVPVFVDDFVTTTNTSGTLGYTPAAVLARAS